MKIHARNPRKMSFAEEILIPSIKMESIQNSVQVNNNDHEAILYLVGMLLLLTVVYSFVINILFGHRTYWRSVEEWVPKRVISIVGRLNAAINKLDRESSKKAARRIKLKGQSMTDKMNRKLVLTDISSHVLVHMCTFLSPADIVTCANVCKRLSTITETNYLWMVKWKEIVSKNLQYSKNLNAFTDLNSYLGDTVKINMKAKVKFFCGCRQLYHSILREGVHKGIEDTGENGSENENNWPSSCPVIIYGDIYELRSFLRSHPGGAAILLEWRGEDGTRVFHLAAHSKYARVQMKQYLVWSQKDMIGKKGWPAFSC